VFKSNPGFVFHDSCGFESGGIKEMNQVREFIAHRSKMVSMEQRVHTIWYIVVLYINNFLVHSFCRYLIPVDGNRPFTKAEDIFFSEDSTSGGKPKMWMKCHQLIDFSSSSTDFDFH
jgi:hypothetical protein